MLGVVEMRDFLAAVGSVDVVVIVAWPLASDDVVVDDRDEDGDAKVFCVIFSSSIFFLKELFFYMI